MSTPCQTQTKSNNFVLLVQPQMGLSGEFARHLPLSLIYVAAPIRKMGIDVEILDRRIDHKQSWQELLKEALNRKPLWVGFTVMAGYPIVQALEMSEFIKKNSPETPVVWGGALPTIDPKSCLTSNNVDFTASGSGIAETRMLTQAILDDKTSDKSTLAPIPGLGFKIDGVCYYNKRFEGFEPVHYKDLPYDVIKDYSVYGQIGTNENIFPIYSAYGCPYQCAFCVSPMLYKTFSPKWQRVSPSEVADHIEYLNKTYKATTIYFYDDDSFVDIEHIRSIVLELKQRNLKLKLSFRGARVNEIMKMDDEFLDLLSETGTEMLHIGIESGCQRILNLYNKGITVDNIFEINKKLAKHPRLIAAYNWIVGAPSETLDEIKESTRVITKLIKENPKCFVFQPNIFRVVPGSVLGEKAREYGYKEPTNLDEWIKSELEQEVFSPWFSEEMKQHIKMLQVTSYFIDNKAQLLLHSGSIKDLVIKVLSKIYQPLARFRVKSNWSSMLIEAKIFFLAQKFMKKLR